jgi:hypothetical protein
MSSLALSEECAKDAGAYQQDEGAKIRGDSIRMIRKVQLVKRSTRIRLGYFEISEHIARANSDMTRCLVSKIQRIAAR